MLTKEETRKKGEALNIFCKLFGHKWKHMGKHRVSLNSQFSLSKYESRRCLKCNQYGVKPENSIIWIPLGSARR